MKTYGRISLSNREPSRPRLIIAAPPHIRMRLKQVFPKISKDAYGPIQLMLGPETACDIEWFNDRFPMEWDADAQRLVRRLSKLHRQRLEELESVMQAGYVPRNFDLAKPLRQYQAIAVEVFLRNQGLLVGDDLGLGKTVTAMGTLTQKASLPALVVCPVHLCRQWQSMLGEFLPLMNSHIIKQTQAYALPDVDVFIISYSKLAAWAEYFCHACFKVVIFDECQELRRTGDPSKPSRKYHAAKAIAQRTIGRLGLSATPVYNYGDEIFNILEVLSPGRLGTREEFHREWCESIPGDKWMVKEPQALGLYLRDQFLMLRRTRADVGLELPQVERSVTSIPFNTGVLDDVEDSAIELAKMVLAGGFEESGEAARQLDSKLRQATGIAKAPYVAEFVRLLVESNENVLLFGWHREVYEVWMHKLADLNPVLYTGTESEAQKAQAAAKFTWGNSRVMIMSLRSGLGLDGLQKICRTAVFGELDWSPGVHEQCIGRLNRDGVGAGVLAYFLVAEGGSDPVVASVLGLKRSQHAGVMDMVTPGENAASGLQQTSNAQRVKDLAREFLSKRGIAAPVRVKNSAPVESELVA